MCEEIEDDAYHGTNHEDDVEYVSNPKDSIAWRFASSSLSSWVFCTHIDVVLSLEKIVFIGVSARLMMLSQVWFVSEVDRKSD